MNADDLAKQADFDRHMTAAHVARRRGDYDQAAQSVVEAMRIRPDDPDARELAADILYARGDIEKAAAEYKIIFEADNTRASAEEKFAKATIELAEQKRQKDLMQLMIDDPEAFRRSYLPTQRSPWIAALLSGFPGLGHVYCGKYIRGSIVFVASFLCWWLFLTLRPQGVPTTQFFTDLSAGAVFFLSAGVAVHLFAIIDAAAIAERTTKGAKRHSEP